MIFEEDDEIALSILTSSTDSWASQRENSLSIRFESLASRLLSDVCLFREPKTFWSSLERSASSLRFQSLQYKILDESLFTLTDNKVGSWKEDENSLPPLLRSELGMKHLHAVASLLRVPLTRAASLTLGAICSLQQSFECLSLHPSISEMNAEFIDSFKSLLGTTDLLILVRDYHYTRQVARIRLVAEALRIEQQQNQRQHGNSHDDDGSEYSTALSRECMQFLDMLDGKSKLHSVGIGGNSSRRGLFQILLTLACAPITQLDRQDIHPAASSLYVHRNSNETSFTTYDDIVATLAKCHDQHYERMIRTEALEALLVLLYQRIDCGVSRYDYLTVLLAFNRQSFFSRFDDRAQGAYDLDRDPQHRNNKAQNRSAALASLILVESLCLWKSVDSYSLSSNQTVGDSRFLSVDVHPMLAGDNFRSVGDELKAIGETFFLEKSVSKDVYERERSLVSSDIVTSDAVGAVGLLSFGLFLRLLPHAFSLKELGDKCVSVANDVCGAFDYLHMVLSFLLPSSRFLSNSYHINNDHFVDLVNEQTIVECAAEDCKSDLKLSSDQIRKDFIEPASQVAYASIGREVLIATISAFQRSLVGKTVSSSRENISMLCDIAAIIYRNTTVLCEKFWIDWDEYCKGSDNSNVKDPVELDPICWLLDAAYQLATSTLEASTGKKNTSARNMIDAKKSVINLLPSLSPFLRLVSSIIPRNADIVEEVVRGFFPDLFISFCLLGCLQVSSLLINSEENLEYVRAAQSVLQSLQTLAYLTRTIQPNPSLELLRIALSTGADDHGICGGVIILLDITKNSMKNTTFDSVTRNIFVSSSISVLADLTHFNSNRDLTWILCLGGEFGKGFLENYLFDYSDISLSSLVLLERLSACLLPTVFLGPTEEKRIESYVGSLGETGVALIDAYSSFILKTTPTHTPPSRHSMCLASSCFASILYVLKASDAIACYHPTISVKKIGISVRNNLIKALSASSAFCGILVNEAVLPVILEASMATRAFSQVRSVISYGKDHRLTSKKMEPRAYVDEKKFCGWDDYSPSVEKSYPQFFEKLFRRNIIGIADAELQVDAVQLAITAFSLLIQWCITIEHMVAKYPHDAVLLERREVDSQSISLLQTMNTRVSFLQVDQTGDCVEADVPAINAMLRYLFLTNDNGICDDKTISLSYMVMTLINSCINLHSRAFLNEVETARNSHIKPFASKVTGRLIQDAIRNILTTLCDSAELPCERKYLLTWRLIHLSQLLKAYIIHNPLFMTLLFKDRSVTAKGTETLVNLIVIVTERYGKAITTNCDAAIASCCIKLILAINIHARLQGVLGTNEALADDRLISTCLSIVRSHSKLLKLSHMVSRKENDKRKQSCNFHSHSLIQTLINNSLSIITNAIMQCKVQLSSVQDITEKNFIVEWFNECLSTNAMSLPLKYIEEMKSSTEVISKDYLETVGFVLFNEHSSEVYIDCLAATKLAKTNLVLLSTLFTFTKSFYHHVYEDRDSFWGNDWYSVLIMIKLARQTVESVIGGFSYWGIDFVREFLNYIDSLIALLLAKIQCCTRMDIDADEQEIRRRCGEAVQIAFDLSHLSRCLYHALSMCESHEEPFKDFIFKIKASVLTSILNVLVFIKSCNGQKSQESYTNACVDFARQACDCLQQVSEHISGMKSNSSPVERGGVKIDALEPFIVVHASVAILQVLLPVGQSPQDSNAVFHSMRYETIVDTVLQVIPLFSDRVASCLNYNERSLSLIEDSEPDLESVATLLDFLLSVTDSMPAFIIKKRAVSRFLTNQILLMICEKWKIDSSYNNSMLRGYSLFSQGNNLLNLGYSQRSCRKLTISLNVHNIWLAVVRTTSALLHQATFLRKTFDSSSTLLSDRVVMDTVDFVRRFENVILSILNDGFLIRDKDRPAEDIRFGSQNSVTLSASRSSSAFTFTLNGMKEARDVLMLLSELFSANYGRIFHGICPSLHRRLRDSALQVVRSLSLFLGGISSARELFSLLRQVNQALKPQGSTAEDKHSFQESVITHPALSDGIPYARNEAISFAHYTRSCCVCVTSGEYNLLQNGEHQDSNLQAECDHKVDRSYEDSINNKFVKQLERLALECTLIALSIAEKTHPTGSSFLKFSPEEAMLFKSSSALRPGSIVAIRPWSLTNGICKVYDDPSSLVFCRIISCNSVRNTIAVKSLVSEDVERDVCYSRIACIEDITKRKSIFAFYHAPKSSSDFALSSLSSDVTIGHLILILRWCCHKALTLSAENLAKETQLKSVAESAALLIGTEISVHLELDAFQTIQKDVLKNIASQLLDFFEYSVEVHSANFSSRSHTTRGFTGTLKQLVDKRTWNALQYQLTQFLWHSSASHDLTWTQPDQAISVPSPVSLSHSIAINTERRSPFRQYI